LKNSYFTFGKEYMTYKEQMDQEYKRGKAEGEEERKALKNENEFL
jgi:hypothetical protein